MQTLIFAVGLIAAMPLVVLMVATIIYRPLGFWPTAGKWTWQSLTFWSLFRILNTVVLCLPIFDHEPAFGLPWDLRLLGVALFLVSGALYLYALFALGRDNTYCRRGGLVTDGVYRWTRNPQYATVIPAYLGLAVAADDMGVFLLVAPLIAVYVLMAHAEESWLLLQYGREYERYARTVPRFFNFRRAWLVLKGATAAGLERARPAQDRRGEQRTRKP